MEEMTSASDDLWYGPSHSVAQVHKHILGQSRGRYQVESVYDVTSFGL